MEFNGKTVLITGATSGIGRATAERFARDGAHVVVSGRDAARGREVVEAIEQEGGTARFVAADLAQPGAAAQLADEAGDVDVLVNNAGIFPVGPTHELPSDAVREVFEVNVVAANELVARLAPKMADRGSGSIVNVSTMVASFGMPGLGAYGASKAALELLTKGWAAEYGAQGVRVNAVAPGPTRTPGTAVMGEEAVAQLAGTTPLQRAAQAEEIAAAITFLASDEAGYVTGAILPTDGGRVAV